MQLYESLFVVAAALGERDLRLSELLQVGPRATLLLYMSCNPLRVLCLSKALQIPATHVVCVCQSALVHCA